MHPHPPLVRQPCVIYSILIANRVMKPRFVQTEAAERGPVWRTGGGWRRRASCGILFPLPGRKRQCQADPGAGRAPGGGGSCEAGTRTDRGGCRRTCRELTSISGLTPFRRRSMDGRQAGGHSLPPSFRMAQPLGGSQAGFLPLTLGEAFEAAELVGNSPGMVPADLPGETCLARSEFLWRSGILIG